MTLERRAIEFEREDFRLSETTRFTWRRNLPSLVAKKTVFNYVATYNDFERHFAEFVDNKDDPSQLAWLEACISVGLPLDSFALVRYDAGRPLPGALSVVDLSATRRKRAAVER